MIVHPLNQGSGIQWRPTQGCRADGFTTAAIHAGVQIEQALPGILLDLIGSEDGLTSRTLVVRSLEHGFDVWIRKCRSNLQIAEENVQRTVQDVIELPGGEVSDENECRDDMKPPRPAVNHSQRLV